MELKVMIPLLIIQPNRVQEGTVAAARNADVARQIEKDVDALLCLHRNRESVMKQKNWRSSVTSSWNATSARSCMCVPTFRASLLVGCQRSGLKAYVVGA